MLVSEAVLTGQQKIAQLAKNAPDMSFISLNKYLTKEWLGEAYRQTRKGGATGVDGQTASEYEEELQENLADLLERAKSGRYYAPPVLRALIPKGDGSNVVRKLGIPTFEDKLLQRAVAMIIEPIYEQDFLPCSYGFRPKRSAHDCIKDLRSTLHQWGGGYVIDADIKGYFASINKPHLRAILDDRVRDGVIRRLIGKWLEAGVQEKGQIKYPETGTPEGGVISPLLSNVYLHEVLDKWFSNELLPGLKSSVRLFRYADDFVIVCKSNSDAERIMDELPKRFEKFGLTIHPEKTRQLNFRGPTAIGGKPPTFDFLGFTFYWGKTRGGRYVTMLKTRKARFSRSIRKLHELCRAIRHEPIRKQQQRLNRVLIGLYNYYGVTFNHRQIARVKRQATKSWRYWLDRRGEKRRMPWVRFEVILKFCPLAPPKIKVALF